MNSVEEIRVLLNSLENEDYRRKMLELYDLVLRDGFADGYAAKNNHHAYKGGLPDHTLEVMKYALKLYEITPKGEWNYTRDDVLISAFAHDLAKMKVYYLDEQGFIQAKRLPCSQEAIVFRYFAFVGYSAKNCVLSAVEYAHGGWATQSNDRFIRPHPLFVIIHSADLFSAWFYKLKDNDDKTAVLK
jgi:hypothetical protein